MPGKRFECMLSVSQRKNTTLVIDLTNLVIKNGLVLNCKHTYAHSLLYKCIRYLICMYRSESERSAPPEETRAMRKGVMRPVMMVIMTTSSFDASPHTSNLLF